MSIARTAQAHLSNYHQSKDERAGLPQTVTEKIHVTSTPNTCSYKSHVFATNPALVQRYIKATKADEGGVGGHMVAADEVKSVVAKFVLETTVSRPSSGSTELAGPGRGRLHRQSERAGCGGTAHSPIHRAVVGHLPPDCWPNWPNYIQGKRKPL